MSVLLLDNFTGAAGALSAHAADSGASWAGSGSHLVLDGSGRLYDDLSNDSSSSLVSDLVLAQSPVSLEMVVTLGTIPASAFNYGEQIYVAMWGWYDFAVEVDSRGNGDGTPRLYAAAHGASYDMVVASGQSHTIRWDIRPGVGVDVFVDGSLVVSGTVRADVGNFTLGGYFSRFQDAGASNQSAFLLLNTLTLTPIAPPPNFWTGFVKSHEVI